jgi:methyl-accepting chemotaxis protein
MAEITAASQEQTSGIEQINQAITQMDQVTQQNAALVEEAAAAASSLQEQAANLSQVVSVFKMDRAQEQVAQHQQQRSCGPPGCDARNNRRRPARQLPRRSASPLRPRATWPWPVAGAGKRFKVLAAPC